MICYFVGYPHRSKGYKYYCRSQNTRIVECTNVKLFENGNFSGSTKGIDIIFEEERQTVTVVLVLNKIDDISVERNAIV